MADEADHTRLSRLSCSRCKGRKVRCSRAIPRCERCKSLDMECVYPERVERRTTTRSILKESKHRSTRDDDALNVILERLHRLEQQSIVQSFKFSNDTNLPVLGSSVSSSPAASIALTSQVSSEWSPVPFPTPSSQKFDATAILKDAIDHVQKLKLRDYARSVITDKIEIPPELARKWIHNYFTYMQTDMFLSLVNRRVIELIPELHGLPHVHLEPSILVLYYGILYHGCTLGASNVHPERGTDYAKSCYVACLRALPGWQRESTGCTTDFIAAVFMVRVSLWCFDFDLSWKMFTRACDYAQGLELHNLDGGDEAGHNPRIRLIFNKPPSITATAWKVNLPSITVNSQPPPVQTVTFLVNSRVTMVIINFFILLEQKQIATQELRQKTEDLCREIKQLFIEWQLDGWYTTVRSKEDNFIVLDTLLTGYTCIIFMLHNVDVLESRSRQLMERDADLPDSPLALEAAREIVKIFTQAISLYPGPEIMSTLFGVFGANIPTACLYSTVLSSADVGAHRADVQLLEQLSGFVSTVARTEREHQPLVRALETLNTAIQRRFNDAKS